MSKIMTKQKKKMNIDDARMAKVLEAFNPDQLRMICALDEEAFGLYGEYHTTPDESFYYYNRTGSQILLVAHLDSVQQDRAHFKVSSDGQRIWSPVLDDRLGAYAVTTLLPLLGIEADLLLTTGEESGSSTAQQFACPAKYNWIVEFDRAGGDVVTYDYKSRPWEDALIEAGFRIGIGSYSDISDLEHLGACAVNIGVGYQKYHSHDAYFDVPVFLKNIARFLKFYDDNNTVHFPHTKIRYNKYSHYGYGGSKSYAYDDDDDWYKYRDQYTNITAATAKTPSLPPLPKTSPEAEKLVVNTNSLFKDAVKGDTFRSTQLESTLGVRCPAPVNEVHQYEFNAAVSGGYLFHNWDMDKYYYFCTEEWVWFDIGSDEAV